MNGLSKLTQLEDSAANTALAGLSSRLYFCLLGGSPCLLSMISNSVAEPVLTVSILNIISAVPGS